MQMKLCLIMSGLFTNSQRYRTSGVDKGSGMIRVGIAILKRKGLNDTILEYAISLPWSALNTNPPSAQAIF